MTVVQAHRLSDEVREWLPALALSIIVHGLLYFGGQFWTASESVAGPQGMTVGLATFAETGSRTSAASAEPKNSVAQAKAAPAKVEPAKAEREPAPKRIEQIREDAVAKDAVSLQSRKTIPKPQEKAPKASAQAPSEKIDSVVKSNGVGAKVVSGKPTDIAGDNMGASQALANLLSKSGAGNGSGQGNEQNGGGGGGIQGDLYARGLIAAVQKVWQVPQGIQAEGLLAKIRIRITSNGDLAEVELVQSSGVRLFDVSALQAVRAAAPLPPLPSQLGSSYAVTLNLRPSL